MATLQNISIPSIPSVPQFPSIPTSLVSVNLPCGQNPALDALTLVQNKIKDQLATGKGALGTLGTLINTANEKLLAIQPKIEEFYSFQADLASLKSNPSPATIAAILNRWKGKVPGLEGYITKATDLLSKTPLDYCQDLPNIKIDQQTGAVSIDAKAAIIPNESPPIAVSVAPTVVDNTSDTTIGNSGLSFQVVKDYNNKVLGVYLDEVHLPIIADHKAAKKKFDTTVNGKTPTSVFGNKLKNFGMSPDQLEDAGLLTAEEIQVKNTYQTAFELHRDTVFILTVAAGWYSVYERQLINPNDQSYNSISNSKKTNPLFKKAGALKYFDITESILDKNKNLVIDFDTYQKNKPK
jgi:hypothetical protein